MDLRELRSLVVLAEERHFTRAAARLHIAQPALSQQIGKLERELGLGLVDRTTRSVALTAAGELLVSRARAVLAQVDDARAELQQLGGLLAGRATIGITQTPGPLDPLPLLAGFNARFPAVELAVREDLSTVLAAQLRADTLDLAFLSRIDAADARGLAQQPLAQERLVAVLAPAHRLAHRRRIAIADLREDAFVAFPQGATIREAVRRAAADAGFVPRIAFETRDVARTRAFAAAGLGVAVLPRSDAQAPGPAVVEVALTPALTHRVSLCWREGRRHAPAARALLERARATYGG